jgi:hypothetical protein
MGNMKNKLKVVWLYRYSNNEEREVIEFFIEGSSVYKPCTQY